MLRFLTCLDVANALTLISESERFPTAHHAPCPGRADPSDEDVATAQTHGAQEAASCGPRDVETRRPGRVTPVVVVEFRSELPGPEFIAAGGVCPYEDVCSTCMDLPGEGSLRDAGHVHQAVTDGDPPCDVEGRRSELPYPENVPATAVEPGDKGIGAARVALSRERSVRPSDGVEPGRICGHVKREVYGCRSELNGPYLVAARVILPNECVRSSRVCLPGQRSADSAGEVQSRGVTRNAERHVSDRCAKLVRPHFVAIRFVLP